MPTVAVSETLNVHYEVDDFTDPWEERPFLVLQHGNGRTGEFWYRWIPYLSRYYRVIRPDMRGLGQSGMPLDLNRDITLDLLLSDLTAIFQDVGAESVHYCGESMGGIWGLR